MPGRIVEAGTQPVESANAPAGHVQPPASSATRGTVPREEPEARARGREWARSAARARQKSEQEGQDTMETSRAIYCCCRSAL